MKKSAPIVLFYCICVFFNITESYASETNGSIAGFWKTINEKTLMPECIIAIYEHRGQYFGRIILTYRADGSLQDTLYNPEKRALGVLGNPYYSGLDIIWGLRKKGGFYTGGSILDPLRGNIYRAEAWKEKDRLVVRGIWFIFWRNQTWPKALDADFPEGFHKPDFFSFTPIIPKVN